MPFSCEAIFLGTSIRLSQREPSLPLKRLLPPSQVPCAHSPLLLGEGRAGGHFYCSMSISTVDFPHPVLGVIACCQQG